MCSKNKAFTLVELLVVIGIIALLISILLPALNKARQQASLLDCQARLRTMGQALQIYTTESKSSLPWGVIEHGAPWTPPFVPSSANQEKYWWWYFTLSEVLDRQNARTPDGYVRVSPIFRDRDTVEAPSEPRWVNHYIANPRILYQANNVDNAPAIFSSWTNSPEMPELRRARKLSTIKKLSDVFVIWDGPQFVDQGYNTYGLAAAIDSWGMDNTTGLCFNAPSTSNQYGRAILPGAGIPGSGVADGKAAQKVRNSDFERAFDWYSALRFRHMANTTLAALCLDSHVETRKVGTVMRGDIFTNYK